ncbi:uncharacterized protein LOC131447238 [Solea solea]|uniref:uncharacterized protein LOC131447238 n=1 Tax=Solea solea TaxID=90069 RepID=UPI002729EDEF|nr:uncharacterized protein LOC131447238 [Solea solea]
MAKKTSSRKTLKSLFSRSEANLDASPVKDVTKAEREKKKFKLFKFKTKSKNESLEALGDAEPNHTAEDGEAWDADKRTSLYATTSRSKGKEISYSEMDLRKPKRFATFSFGFKKKKRRNGDTMSKSLHGLHNSDIDEDDEATMDLSQVELDQGDVRAMFSMSQPELDKIHKFDIPSPPPVDTNPFDSYFAVSDQSESNVTTDAPIESKQPPGDFHSLEIPTATVHSIPELNDNNVSIPVHDNMSKGDAESIYLADNKATPSLPATQPPVMLHTTDHKAAAAAADSGFSSNGLCDNDTLQQPYTKTNISPTESTGVTLTGAAGSTAPSGELSLRSADSLTESSATPRAETVTAALSTAPATFHEDVSRSAREITKSVPTTSAKRSEKSPRLYSENVVYGALYDSLFPQSFSSEVISSISNSPPQNYTKSSHLSTKSEAIMVKTSNESHSEMNVSYSHLSASQIGTQSSLPSPKSPPVMVKTLNEGTSETNVSYSRPSFSYDNESSLLSPKSQPVMVKTLNECNTETNVSYSNMSSSRDNNGKMDFAESSFSNPLPSTESSLLSPKSQPVMVKTLNECNIETNVSYSNLSSSRDIDGRTDFAERTFSNTQSGTQSSLPSPKSEPVMVKTLNEGTSETNVSYSRLSPSRDIDGRIDFAESTFSNPPTPTQSSLPSPKYQPVTVKTLNEGTSETNVSYSRSSSSRVTDSSLLSPKSQPVTVKTLNECNTETNVSYSNLSYSPDIDSPFSQTLTPTDFQTDIHYSYLPSSPRSPAEPVAKNIPYSELTHSDAESDNYSTFVRSVPVLQSSAPPIPDYAASHGTDTQVTDTKQRAILVKELVTDGASTDSVCPSPALEKMSAVKSLELIIEEPETFYAAPGSVLSEESEGPLSPTYLSVGSDDGSAMEVYYSAEEDNTDESGEEEIHAVEEREDVCVVKEMEWRAGGAKSQEDEGDVRVVVVKMLNDVGNVGRGEDFGGTVESRLQETLMSHFLVTSDARWQEREGASRALPQIKEEEEEEEEELPATPVRLVNSLKVCENAPPSSEQHVQGEWSHRNWTMDSETEGYLHGGKQLLSQETDCLSDKHHSEYMHPASSNTKEDSETNPTSTETEKPFQSAESVESKSNTVTDMSVTEAQVVTGFSTHNTELQSDATEIEDNRAPQSSEWVDTISRSADGGRTLHEQVTVELSSLVTADTGTLQPQPESQREGTSSSERHELLAQVQPNLQPGSSTDSRSDSAASGGQQTKADQKSVTKMSSGYSSLSTKLTINTSSPPKEDDFKQRFHKVSLIPEAGSRDTVDFSGTSAESNGTVVGSEYRWRNRFDVASQYRPYNEEDSSDSPSYRTSSFTSSTSPSSLPGATSYSSLLNSSSFSSSAEEHPTLGDRLSDKTRVYVSQESETAGEQPLGEWRRRSLVEQEEPAAPAGVREERGRESESEWIKSRWDSQEQPASLHTDTVRADDDDESSQFTGLFKATLVQLVCEPAAPPSTPPASPDADSSNRSEMDSLVDTLKNMGPSFRPRGVGPRAAPPGLVSSLPPIVEDASSPINPGLPASLTKTLETTGTDSEAQNGIYTLPPDLGLKRSFIRDSRSPLELMKEQQPGARGPTLPLRSSATNSVVIRNSSDSSTEDGTSTAMNGNGVLSPTHTASRLDNSIIFTRFRSPSLDQTGDNDRVSRPLYRTSSLPDTGPLSERMNAGPKELTEAGAGKDLPGSRFERLSILMNSSSSSSGSLTNTEDNGARMSRPPQLGFGSPPSSNSPTRLLSPTGSIDLHRSFTTTDSPLSMFGSGQAMGAGLGGGSPGTPVLQRSFSSDGSIGVQQSPMFNSFHGGSPFQSKEPEPDRNLISKYRAFPDAYLTKEKEHGKLNPRPGKMYIFDQPGFCGQRIEIRSDITDATSWVLQETISIRVVRGGWVLYEKPNFKGEKVALDEGDIELTNPFSPPDEEQLQNGQKEDEQKQNGETSDQQTETAPPRRLIIGSLRRAVRDYSVPEISLFPEENAEGKKVIFRDTSDDARIFGFPIKANSIIINAGLWLVFAQPFFQGVPRVLEVGGYSNPAAWGVEQPYVGSVHPLKIGEPRVENVGEPKLVIFDKPYFSGKSRTITTNMRDFMTRVDRQQAVFMYNIGSLKVQGGIWVGYEKEGFRGHQYLLEEGEYQDWRVWGGHDSELRSVRLIQADLTDPLMVMFEQLEEDQEGMQEENTFEVTEAIPDVELFGYKTSTRSIHVISGAWIAYSHVDFSGKQYILEKGFYTNCADWGSQDTRICSLQPILLAPRDNVGARNEIILFSEPDLQGNCNIFDRNQQVLTEKFVTKSCRVVGGSWVLYEKEQYAGDLYVLNEGEYPNLASMGCPSTFPIRSVKVVPMTFSVPSLSLFGLEGLEGREITTDTEIISMTREGLNNHILSIRVNSGCWVICEYSNYRGRQFVLETIEITNWPKFSSLNTIGSVYPVRQKRHFFRIKNKESGLFMSIQGGVEEMKSGRVVVAAEAEPMSDIWFYQDGFIKSKLTATMSLQVMGNVEPSAKVVLWSETRQPSQNWTAQMSGPIRSLTFPGMVLDVKGGKSYDKDHVVIMPENEERPSQDWELELL